MTEETLTVELTENAGKGRYFIALPGGEEAEMTYVKPGPGHIVIDHTYVPRSQRGRGIAEKLVQKAIADARASGTRITPVCSYVVAEFRRHPEWADLLKS